MADSANVPVGKVEIKGNDDVCDTYGLDLTGMCQLGSGVRPIRLNDVDPKDVSSDPSKAAILRRFQEKGASALLYYGNGKWHLIVREPNKAWVMEDDIKKELFSKEDYDDSLKQNVIRMKKRVFDGDIVVFCITMNNKDTMVRVAVDKENKQKYEKNKSELEQPEKKGLKALYLTGEENAKRRKETDEKHASLRRDRGMKRKREKMELEKNENSKEPTRKAVSSKENEKERETERVTGQLLSNTIFTALFSPSSKDCGEETGFPELFTSSA